MKILNVVFLSILGIFIFGCNGELSDVSINTPTIQCGMCQKNIELGLTKLKGISSSEVDLATKVTKVKYYKDLVNLSQIENAISNIGYQANAISANSEKYELLPACCKIGGMDKM